MNENNCRECAPVAMSIQYSRLACPIHSFSAVHKIVLHQFLCVSFVFTVDLDVPVYVPIVQSSDLPLRDCYIPVAFNTAIGIQRIFFNGVDRGKLKFHILLGTCEMLTQSSKNIM